MLIRYTMRQSPGGKSVHVSSRSAATSAFLRSYSLAKSNLGIGIDKSLLIDSADALNRAYIVGVLRSQIARMSRLDLAMSLFLLLGLFHGQNLRFRQHVAWLL